MRGRRSKLLMIVAAISLIVFGLWSAQHARDKRESAAREVHYQTVLSEYASDLKPGMSRVQVEQRLQSDGRKFKQMCCVANFKNEYVSFGRAGWDDLVKIAEESAPFVCSENKVYIAFEFNPKSTSDLPKTNPSDILKRVSIFHQLEGCP